MRRTRHCFTPLVAHCPLHRRTFAVGLFALAVSLNLLDIAPDSQAAPRPDAPAKTALPTFKSDVLPFLTRHCFSCHGNGKDKGDLTLDTYRDDVAIQKDRKVWENVVQMVRSGEMPPKESKKPDAVDAASMLKNLESVLDNVDCTKGREAGRVTLHRLNRTEYNNTIRDLAGVDFKPAGDFPNDDVGYGFDNIGDVLSLSPLLLEKYLTAAETILEKAIVIADPPKPVKTPISSIRFYPRNGGGETRRGLGKVLYAKAELYGETFIEEGEYVVRVEAFGQQLGDETVRGTVTVGDIKKEFEVKAKADAPETLEVKIKVEAGTCRVWVGFLNPFVEKDTKKERLLVVRNISLDGPYNAPAPKLPESHLLVMAHKAGLKEREAAREIVARFATRAFRRPAKPEEVERFLKLYDKSETGGERFENRLRLALGGVLVSPHFLFRVELDPADARAGMAYPVNEYELASRLSYFLWSTMPDEELFALAAKGELRKNLDAQMKRMLKDSKSAAFVQNFAGQWLTIRKLAEISPDPKVFPGFDDELRSAMYRETELFFDAMLREDHSILDFLDADFSFANERLAKHYGIPGVEGKEFRRVKLPANRGGILTQASILTLTSNSTRTAPVKRGKFVLDQILNTPPPPPPPDVPNLPLEHELTGSLRKVMEQHRDNPVCASCHQRMDPIGFAFENFDAIGAWRDKDGKHDIDPSGVLPDGKTFQGPQGLKALLKEKKELFSRCLAEKVLTYALGRGLEYYDRCAVDAILKTLDKNDYKFSILLSEVVRSEPFQMRTATGKKQ